MITASYSCEKCGARVVLPDILREITQAARQACARSLVVSFQTHNCFPGLVTWECSCGAKRVSGPTSHPGQPFVRAQEDIAWWGAHVDCKTERRIGA
jgi:hypothetical protein